MDFNELKKSCPWLDTKGKFDFCKATSDGPSGFVGCYCKEEDCAVWYFIRSASQGSTQTISRPVGVPATLCNKPLMPPRIEDCPTIYSPNRKRDNDVVC